VVFLMAFDACKEQGRFEIGFDDTEPPSAPVYIRYKPLYGGARLFYQIPRDEDIISIDASYTVKNNDNTEKEVWFSISYFTDSLDVYGFDDTTVHIVKLYAVDRAGNKSDKTVVPVKPLEPSFSRVAKSLKITPGFGSFYIDWVNELEQNINVYVDFDYNENGTHREQELIYTSRLPSERWFITGLDNLAEGEQISIKMRVEDQYGNLTSDIDKGKIVLLQDEVIPKNKWRIFEANDSIGGEPMGFFAGGGQSAKFIIDGFIDDGINRSYGHTYGVGRTGRAQDPNAPWNFIIDLGEEYELSRIVTNQRFEAGHSHAYGTYYTYFNVGSYALYVGQVTGPDQNTGVRWDYVGRTYISVPSGTEMEIYQSARAGDMAYFYPEAPKFTAPTRWFRYEALTAFHNIGYGPDVIMRPIVYASPAMAQQLSEITLYARKK
jgi:hypothetical protein